jgi:hypothetical protein
MREFQTFLNLIARCLWLISYLSFQISVLEIIADVILLWYCLNLISLGRTFLTRINRRLSNAENAEL